MGINKILTVYVLSLIFIQGAKSSNIERLNECLITYDYVDRVCNGLIKVKKNGKCGFVNKKGKEIISLNSGYEDMGEVSNFHSSVCPLKLNDSIIFLDKKGHVIETPTIYAVENGIVCFQRGLERELGVIGEKGIRYFDNNMYDIRFADPYVVLDCDDGTKEYSVMYDREGELIMKYDHICFQYKSEEDKSKKFVVKKEGKYGIVNKKNKIIVPFKLNSDCDKFHTDGRYVFYENPEGKIGVMSINCDTILSADYENYKCYGKYVFAWAPSKFDMVYENKRVNETKFGNLHVRKCNDSIILSSDRNNVKIDRFYIDNDLLVYFMGDSCGIFDKNGRNIIKNEYKRFEILNNLIIAYLNFDMEESKISLFDKNGRCVENGLYTSFDFCDNSRIKNKYQIFKKYEGNKDEYIIYIWNDKKKNLKKVQSFFSCPYGIRDGLLRIKGKNGFNFIKVK